MRTRGMMRQRRSPSVENGHDADPRAQLSGIRGDRDQRLGRRLEQNVIDRRLVVIGDVGDGRRQGEHEGDNREPAALRLLTRRAMFWPPRRDTAGDGDCGTSYW